MRPALLSCPYILCLFSGNAFFGSEVHCLNKPHEALLNTRLSTSLDENLARLRTILNAGRNADAQFRDFMIEDTRLCAVYIEGMADARRISETILRACTMDRDAREHAITPEYLASRVLETAQCRPETSTEPLVLAVATGMTALLVDGSSEALLLETRGYPARNVDRTACESVVIGAQEGFVESLRTNITLLRRYLPSPHLVTEMLSAGRQVPCAVCLVYLEGVTDPRVVSELRSRIAGISVPAVHGIGDIQQLIEDRPAALLPQMLQTERPDRAAACLMEGQAVLLADNSPCALAAPVTLFHQLHTSDDSFARWQYGSFLRIIRLAGMLISVFLPGMYIALTSYHMHLIPMSLLTAIAETRANVPFPVLVEVLLMEFSFYLINEAGTRMPQQIGSALGIVGALILGQAAVSASIISPMLIIVVSITGLGNYAVPDFSFSLGLILYRQLVIFAGAMFGLYGICLAAFCVLNGICAMTSLGLPYTAPIAPPRPHNPDILLRLPTWLQQRRKVSLREARP